MQLDDRIVGDVTVVTVAAVPTPAADATLPRFAARRAAVPRPSSVRRGRRLWEDSPGDTIAPG